MTEIKSPFDIVNIISSKERLLTPEELDRDYNAFIINRALSNNYDTIFFANEMNKSWGLSKKLQFHFYFFGIDKRKRYGKWFKKGTDTDEEKIKLIKQYFDYSTIKAKEVLPILDKLDIWDEIRSTFKKGGLKNNK